MANNTQVNTGSGDFIRDIDKGSSIKTQVNILDRGGSGAEDLGPLYGDTASGSIAGLTTVNISKPFGMCSVGVQVTGTFVATLQFEVSVDGTNYLPQSATPTGNSGVLATTVTAPGIWQVDVTGMASFRVNCTAYTSGTAVVTLISSTGDSGGRLTGAVPSGNNLIGLVGAQPTYALSTRTITLASMAHNAFANSDTVDNSVTRYNKLLVQLKARSNATVAYPAGYVEVYLSRSIDAGATMDGSGGGSGLGGSQLVGTLTCNQAAQSFAGTWLINDPGPMYRLAVLNQTGASLDATAGNHSLKVLGIN